MSGIQTSIQLNDGISPILANISNVLNMTVGAFYDVQKAVDLTQGQLNKNFDVINIDTIRDAAAAVSLNVQEMNAELENVKPAKVVIDPVWNSQSQIDIFNNSGIERYTQEINSITSLINNVAKSQQAISEQALKMDILPPNALWDINLTGQRIAELGQKLMALQNQDISLLNGDSLQKYISELESMRQGYNAIINLQEQMYSAIENGDISALNNGFNQLNNATEQLEVKLRSNNEALQKINNVEWNPVVRFDIVDGTGTERLRAEMELLQSETDKVFTSQQKINNRAAEMNILPPNAIDDINASSEYFSSLMEKMASFQDVNIDLLNGSELAKLNSDMENTRAKISSIHSIQNNINTAIDNADVSALNSGISQLSNASEQLHHNVRDTSSVIQEMNNIEWSSPQNIEIFQGSGIERYKAEVNSANEMMNRLAVSQQAISQQAANNTLFPANMVSDINGMSNRLGMLQQQLVKVNQQCINDIGAGRACADVESLRGQIHQAELIQEELNSAMRSMDISAANAAYERLNSVIGSTEVFIRDNLNEQDKFNTMLEQGGNAADNLGGKIKGFIGAYLGIQGIKKGAGLIGDWLGIADVGNASERQLQVVMQNMGAIQTEFEAVKTTAAELQQSTTFGADELIGGAGELATYLQSGEAIQVMMGTLADYAAGMGGIEVDKSAMINYATQLGKALDGQFDGLTKKGFTLTDVQKEIIDTGTEMERVAVIQDIIEQNWKGLSNSLANTPQGAIVQFNNNFDDVKATVANELYPSVMVFFNALNENLPMLETMLGTVAQAISPFIEWLGTTGIPLIISAVTWLFDMVNGVGSFISDNWGTIAPILLGIAAAVGVWTVAQWANNAALLACPLTWILIIIVAVIAAIVFIINIINEVTGTSISAAGVIMGVIAVVGAFLWNSLLDTFDKVLTVINFLVNPILAFVNFFGNVFNDPIGSIIHLFGDMADNILSVIQKIASGLDFVFGSNMADTVQGWCDGLANMVDTSAKEFGNGEYEKIVDALDLSVEGLGLSRIKYSDAWQAGYNFGENIGNFNFDDTFSKNEYNQNMDYLPLIAENTSATNKNLSASEEHLKYMRDIAERDVINKFTTAEVVLNLGGITNNLNKNTDIDGVVTYLSDKLKEELEMVAEGVH